MARIHGITGHPRDAVVDKLRMAPWVLIVVGLGIIMAMVVESPNKRLIEAIAGVIFLLVAMIVRTSYALGVLIALLPFPAGTSMGSSNDLVIFALAIVYVVKQLVSGEPLIRRTPIDVPIGMMVVATALSLTQQVGDMKPAIAEVRSLFLSIVLYYLITSACTTKEDAKRLLFGYIVAIAGSAVMAVLQMMFPGTILVPKFIYLADKAKHLDYVRASGTFRNYSTFGQYMALNMVLTSYLFIRARSIFAKAVFIALVAGCSATFVSSAMRGAMFATILGLVYLAIVGRKQIKIHEWLTMVAILVVLAITLSSVMLTYLGTGYLFERMKDFGVERGSSISRAETNVAYFLESLKSPFIGHGPHIRLELGSSLARTTNPHNLYLYLFYTIGALGLAGFIWKIARLYLYSLRAVLSPGGVDPWTRGIATVFHTILVAFAAHEFMDEYLVTPMYQKIIWTMFAILVVVSRNAHEQSAALIRPRAVDA